MLPVPGGRAPSPPGPARVPRGLLGAPGPADPATPQAGSTRGGRGNRHRGDLGPGGGAERRVFPSPTKEGLEHRGGAVCWDGRGLVDWAGPYPVVVTWRGAKAVTGWAWNRDLDYWWGLKPTLPLSAVLGSPVLCPGDGHSHNLHQDPWGNRSETHMVGNGPAGRCPAIVV